MAFNRNTVAVLALFALLSVVASQVSQDGPNDPQRPPHQHQERIRRQILDDELENESEEVEVNADLKNTECDGSYYTTCSDCNTRLICKENAAVYIECPDRRPHCHSGHCSGIPSPTCG